MNEIDKALRRAKNGAIPGAIDDLQRLATDERHRHAALGNRAWLLFGLGRYDEAADDYRAICESVPDDLEAAQLLALSLARAGHPDDGARLITQLLGAQDVRRLPLAVRVLGECQRALGVEPHALDADSNTEHSGARFLNDAIARLESSPGAFPSSVNPIIGRLLHDLTRCLRPRVVVEIGCYVGYSTLCIAQALRENGPGHIHAFDLFLDKPDYVSPITGQGGDALEMCHRHVEEADLADRVTFHKGDSSTRVREFFSGKGVPIDLAFIDGDHTIRGCRKDWLAVEPHLSEGAVVCLHDTFPRNCHWMGPHHLLKELVGESIDAYQAINLPTPEGFGVAFAQRISTDSLTRLEPSFIEALKERVFPFR